MSVPFISATIASPALILYEITDSGRCEPLLRNVASTTVAARTFIIGIQTPGWTKSFRIDAITAQISTTNGGTKILLRI